MMYTRISFACVVLGKVLFEEQHKWSLEGLGVSNPSQQKPRLILSGFGKTPICQRDVWRPCADSPGAALQTAARTVLLQTAATLIHANCCSRDGSCVPDRGVRAGEMLWWFLASCSFSVTRGTESSLQNPSVGTALRNNMELVASRCPS